MLSRLHSLLRQLPSDHLPPALLSVGCGTFEDEPTLRAALPNWALYGIDVDGEALRRARQHAPSLRLIQADAINLPGLLHMQFGLVIVRHPDLHLRRKTWSQILPRISSLLTPNGLLVITVYSHEETRLLRSFNLPPAYPVDEHALAPSDMGGRDRYVQIYRVLRSAVGSLKSDHYSRTEGNSYETQI